MEGGKEEEEKKEKTSSIEIRPISITGTFKCLLKFLLCFLQFDLLHFFYNLFVVLILPHVLISKTLNPIFFYQFISPFFSFLLMNCMSLKLFFHQ